jgi:predicted outer membrane repeat protein
LLPTSTLPFLGVLDAGGGLQGSAPIGELGPGIAGLRLALQGVFVHASAADYVSSPSDVELLDKDTLLVDCNGNGVDDALDIALGTSVDLNLNGQPDECDVTLIVPDQYPSIQSAVDDADHKDIVLVRAGTYAGSGNVDVALAGKDIVVMGEAGPAATILDLSLAVGFGFSLTNEPPTTRITGFTLRNFSGAQSPIMAFHSSGTIADCIFTLNTGHGGWGGAVTAEYFYDHEIHTLRVERCRFRQNSAGEGKGGGVYAASTQGTYCSVVVTNCLFEGNSASQGGAIYSQDVDLEVRNSAFVQNTGGTGSAVAFSGIVTGSHEGTIVGCTFFGNLATGVQGALNLGAQDVHSTTVRNSILWGNTGPSGSHVQVSSWGDIQAEIAWSTLQGGIGGWAGPVTVGPGLLAANPAFVHLPSTCTSGRARRASTPASRRSRRSRASSTSTASRASSAPWWTRGRTRTSPSGR